MRERLSIIGIVAFVVLDVILVALAVQHTRGTPPPSDVPPVNRSADSADDERTGPAREREGAAESGEGDVDPAEPLYMSVAADESYVRATRGSCREDSQPLVELSIDGGRSFTGPDVPDLTEVLRVQANGADNLWLVGLDDACAVGTYTTTNGGDSWDRQAGAAGAWHLVQDRERTRIHAPEGVVDTPCVPLSLSTIEAGALRVLCTEGQIIGTIDNGGSWEPLGRLENAVAIRFTSPGDGYAVARLEDCNGAVLRTVDGGTTWETLSCLGQKPARSVAAETGVISAQIGNDLHVSTDGGSNWRVR